MGAKGCLVALNTINAVKIENNDQTASILRYLRRILKYNGISHTPNRVTI